MPFDQFDRRQETLALQSVLVKVRGRGVRRRDQHRIALEQGAQQIAEDHRIADVADEELVEHEHVRIGSDARRDLVQRIRATGKTAQRHVHVLHETMEMHAPLRCRRQRVVEKIAEKRLAAPDRAPKIDAANRVVASAQAPPQRRSWPCDEFVPQPVQIGERGALRRIILPFARGDAGAIARAKPARPVGMVALVGRTRGIRHAFAHETARSGGRLSRTALRTAPRKSSRRRWKK